MFRTIKWYIKFIGSLIINNPVLKKADKLLEQGKNEEYEELVTKKVSDWAMNRMNDSGAKVNVYGIENLPKDGSILFVSNHQSNFDILLLLSYLPVPKGFVAKTELGSFPFVNKWMKKIHCLFMDRHDIKQSAQIIIEGIKQLKSGINMVIFPEGTRSKTGELGEFKAGSFKLATKSKCLIVPITIDGTRKIMEANNYKIMPETINLYIHEPINTSSLSKEEQAQLPDRVRNIINKCLLQ
ncbi:MAG: lysophospholipid acyltransferase family protein [Clostridia bacterium]|nr:lysophospholipid acyltransferase family protein [Clostridia bacterium]